MPIELENRDSTYLLIMRDGENRINRSWLNDMNTALDEIEEDQAAVGLVTTGDEKFFSNGLDIDWMMSADTEPISDFVADVERFFARLLEFPVLTVAACNGHTFAAGAMLALCHDLRVMRGDRGFFCLPEIDIKIPFTFGMDALVRSKLSPQTAHESMVTGRRYGGFEAADRQIIDEAVRAEKVVERSLELAAIAGGKDRSVMATIKRRSYRKVIDLLANSSGTVPMGS